MNRRTDSRLELAGTMVGTLALCGLVFSLVTACVTIPTDCEIAQRDLDRAESCLRDAKCASEWPAMWIDRDEAVRDVARYCPRVER